MDAGERALLVHHVETAEAHAAAPPSGGDIRRRAAVAAVLGATDDDPVPYTVLLPWDDGWGVRSAAPPLYSLARIPRADLRRADLPLDSVLEFFEGGSWAARAPGVVVRTARLGPAFQPVVHALVEESMRARARAAALPRTDDPAAIAANAKMHAGFVAGDGAATGVPDPAVGVVRTLVPRHVLEIYARLLADEPTPVAEFLVEENAAAAARRAAAAAPVAMPAAGLPAPEFLTLYDVFAAYTMAAAAWRDGDPGAPIPRRLVEGTALDIVAELRRRAAAGDFFEPPAAAGDKAAAPPPATLGGACLAGQDPRAAHAANIASISRTLLLVRHAVARPPILQPDVAAVIAADLSSSAATVAVRRFLMDYHAHRNTLAAARAALAHLGVESPFAP